jgi:hypothetical protein
MIPQQAFVSSDIDQIMTSPNSSVRPSINGSGQKSLSMIGVLGNSEQKSSTSGKITCNCKKSKCLKLYCDCFAFGQGCGPDCNCLDCSNAEGNEER